MERRIAGAMREAAERILVLGPRREAKVRRSPRLTAIKSKQDKALFNTVPDSLAKRQIVVPSGLHPASASRASLCIESQRL